MYIYTNIPKRYENVSYEEVPQDIKEKFEAIKTTRKGIYIQGPVGCGKTHILYALYKNSKIKSIVENTSELLREIKKDYGREHRDKEFYEEDLMNFEGILFLDDIGSERMTDWVEEIFYLIVNKRYNKMLPTIFTSNLSIQEIAERVGDRIASRIVGSCDIIKLTGKDKRI